MSQGNDYTKGFVIGALVGGVAGALTALLMAPKSGAELRQDIAVTSKDVYGKSSRFVIDTEKKVEEAVTKALDITKEKAKEIIDTAKSTAENIMKTAKSSGEVDIAFDQEEITPAFDSDKDA